MPKPRPSHVVSAILAIVVLGAGALAVLSSGSPEADPDQVSTFDPAAVVEGDDVACAEFDKQAEMNRRAAVTDPEFGSLSPDDPKLRPHEPGIRGGSVDPDEYIPAAERSPHSYPSPGWPTLAKVSAPLLAPTWLPDELRDLPVFVGSSPEGTAYSLYWGIHPGEGPASPLRLDVDPTNVDPDLGFPKTMPTVQVRGTRAYVAHNFPGGQSVAWYMTSGDVQYFVLLTTQGFDPGTNCRELLAIARSFRPFRPTGGDTPPSGPSGETGRPAPVPTTLAEPTTTLPVGDTTTTVPSATGP